MEMTGESIFVNVLPSPLEQRRRDECVRCEQRRAMITSLAPSNGSMLELALQPCGSAAPSRRVCPRPAGDDDGKTDFFTAPARLKRAERFFNARFARRCLCNTCPDLPIEEARRRRRRMPQWCIPEESSACGWRCRGSAFRAASRHIRRSPLLSYALPLWHAPLP